MKSYQHNQPFIQGHHDDEGDIMTSLLQVDLQVKPTLREEVIKVDGSDGAIDELYYMDQLVGSSRNQTQEANHNLATRKSNVAMSQGPYGYVDDEGDIMTSLLQVDLQVKPTLREEVIKVDGSDGAIDELYYMDQLVGSSRNQTQEANHNLATRKSNVAMSQGPYGYVDDEGDIMTSLLQVDLQVKPTLREEVIKVDGSDGAIDELYYMDQLVGSSRNQTQDANHNLATRKSNVAMSQGPYGYVDDEGDIMTSLLQVDLQVKPTLREEVIKVDGSDGAIDELYYMDQLVGSSRNQTQDANHNLATRKSNVAMSQGPYGYVDDEGDIMTSLLQVDLQVKPTLREEVIKVDGSDGAIDELYYMDQLVGSSRNQTQEANHNLATRKSNVAMSQGPYGYVDDEGDIMTSLLQVDLQVKPTLREEVIKVDESDGAIDELYYMDQLVGSSRNQTQEANHNLATRKSNVAMSQGPYGYVDDEGDIMTSLLQVDLQVKPTLREEVIKVDGSDGAIDELYYMDQLVGSSRNQTQEANHNLATRKSNVAMSQGPYGYVDDEGDIMTSLLQVDLQVKPTLREEVIKVDGSDGAIDELYYMDQLVGSSRNQTQEANHNLATRKSNVAMSQGPYGYVDDEGDIMTSLLQVDLQVKPTLREEVIKVDGSDGAIDELYYMDQLVGSSRNQTQDANHNLATRKSNVAMSQGPYGYVDDEGDIMTSLLQVDLQVKPTLREEVIKVDGSDGAIDELYYMDQLVGSSRNQTQEANHNLATRKSNVAMSQGPYGYVDDEGDIMTSLLQVDLQVKPTLREEVIKVDESDGAIDELYYMDQLVGSSRNQTQEANHNLATRKSNVAMSQGPYGYVDDEGDIMTSLLQVDLQVKPTLREEVIKVDGSDGAIDELYYMDQLVGSSRNQTQEANHNLATRKSNVAMSQGPYGYVDDEGDIMTSLLQVDLQVKPTLREEVIKVDGSDGAIDELYYMDQLVGSSRNQTQETCITSDVCNRNPCTQGLAYDRDDNIISSMYQFDSCVSQPNSVGWSDIYSFASILPIKPFDTVNRNYAILGVSVDPCVAATLLHPINLVDATDRNMEATSNQIDHSHIFGHGCIYKPSENRQGRCLSSFDVTSSEEDEGKMEIRDLNQDSLKIAPPHMNISGGKRRSIFTTREKNSAMDRAKVIW